MKDLNTLENFPDASIKDCDEKKDENETTMYLLEIYFKV